MLCVGSATGEPFRRMKERIEIEKTSRTSPFYK